MIIIKEQFLKFISTPKDTDDCLSSATQHYLSYFEKYQRTGKKLNISWAILYGPYWFMYRKMYLYTFNFWTINFGLMLLKIKTLGDHFMDSFISMGVLSLYILIVLYGDYLHLYHVSYKIMRGNTTGGVNEYIPLIGWGTLLTISVAIFCYWVTKICFF